MSVAIGRQEKKTFFSLLFRCQPLAVKYPTPSGRPVAFIVALRSSEEQKERTLAIFLPLSLLSGGETAAAAGPIQENFKPDSLESRGDLNKSDRMGHTKYLELEIQKSVYFASAGGCTTMEYNRLSKCVFPLQFVCIYV